MRFSPVELPPIFDRWLARRRGVMSESRPMQFAELLSRGTDGRIDMVRRSLESD
jgi:hypothetical protein